MRMKLKSKCASILMMLSFILLHAHLSYCQENKELLIGKHVTFSGKAQPISKIAKEIKSQTGFSLFYSNEFLDPEELFMANVTNEPLESFLTKLLAGRNLKWTADAHAVVIEPAADPVIAARNTVDSVSHVPGRRTLLGTVKGINGASLPGASVRVDKTDDKCIVDKSGNFIIHTFQARPILIVSYTGYETLKYVVDSAKKSNVILKESNLNLDETIIIAYGTSSKRLATGSFEVIKQNRIRQNLGSNPLTSLQGAVPGVLVAQSGGAPGASLKVQIHGQNSIENGSDPLIIVDEVPLAANTDKINALTSIASQNTNAGVTPLTSINGAEIESIEVLKGADATAIYGSRAANGAILITTKNATPGVQKFTVEYNLGSSQVSYFPRVLSTGAYLKMRRTAFNNDGIDINSITAGNAPDLRLWDTTRNMNWPKKLMGGHALVSDIYASYSDGTTRNKILIGCGMHTESTVLPADFRFWKGTFNFSFNHISRDSLLTVSLKGNYSQDENDLFNGTLTSLYLPPNAPEPYKDNKELNWEEYDADYNNPYADLLRKYQMSKENQLMNMKIAYKLMRGLTFSTGFGYNKMSVDEHSIIPISSQNPKQSPRGTAAFASGIYKSRIIEPTAEYKFSRLNHHCILLAGGSWQYSDTRKSEIVGEGYTSDAQLKSITAATYFSTHTGSFDEYKYAALFGRITYNYNDKYLLNLSARRDGSSRFSPESRFHNLWSVGAAWIFTEDSVISAMLPFLSFGKLRGSYGVTGNDQIGDYKYLNTRSPDGGLPYAGIIAIMPEALYNKDFFWEKCSKFELSADLSFFNDRWTTSVTYSRNIGSKQILNRTLPTQTGSGSILQNYNASILNRNWELKLSVIVIKTKRTSLDFGVNITLPENRLLEFENLDGSVYKDMYVKGQSLDVLYKVQAKGVDPQTGKYKLIDKDGVQGYNYGDAAVTGKLDHTIYGGITCHLRHGNFEFQMLGDVRRYMAPNYLHSMYVNKLIPGWMSNQHPMVLDNWKEVGDKAQFAKLSTISNSLVNQEINDVLSSELAYSDVTYFKIRDASVSYNIPAAWLSKMHIKSATVYCKGQNLLTITNYKGGDPETTNLFSFPLQRIISIGVRILL